MLAIVFLILFSCTLLGLVQRCKINLAKNNANRRRNIELNRFSLDVGHPLSSVAFKPVSSIVIISPFDDIPMTDIDGDSLSRAYSMTRDGKTSSIALILLADDEENFVSEPIEKFRPNRSAENSVSESDYDNGSSSIFNDNDYQQDRLSLIESSSSQRKLGKQVTSPDTIIHL